MKNLLSLFLLMCPFMLLAQGGILRGKIIDAGTGEPLIGATVAVKGTTTGGITDFDGNYSIGNLKEGTYVLQASFVSYESKTIEGVQLKSGEVTILNISLSESSEVLQEVVVTAEVIQNSENALLTLQKKSPILFDALSSEQFSRNGDGDIGAAIKRVVGVTVEDGKYVYVRGLGDRYSKTVMNGAEIPGLDPNRNSVQLDMFPTTLIDNLKVYKTFSPELPGDFSGGYVDIQTKDFPEEFTMQLSLSAGFNSQSSFNGDHLTFEGGENELLALGSNSRGLPSSFDGLNNSNFPIAGPENNALSDVFAGRQFGRVTKNANFNQDFSFSIGDQRQLFGKPLGIIGSLTYSHQYEHFDEYRVNRYETPTSDGDELQDTRNYDTGTKSSESVLWGALVSSSLKLNNNNKVKLNVMHNQSGSNNGLYLTGFWNGSGTRPFLETRTLEYIERSFTNGQVSGEHVIAGLNNAKIEWISSYTLSSQNEPDVTFFTNEYSINDETGERENFRISLSYLRPSRYFRELEDTNFDNKLHFTLPVRLWGDRDSKIKVGGAYLMKDRDFSEDRYEFTFNVPYTGDPTTYFTEENLGNGVNVQYATQPQNNYTADVSIYAVYFGLDTYLSEKLRFNGGIRYEDAQFEINTSEFDFEPPIEDILLPSANFTYEVVEDMNIRASYNKTVARPTIRELAPLATFGFNDDGIQNGNPALEQVEIDNFDLRWEYYPKRGEYISVSPFYKRLINPIENTIIVASDLQYQWQNRDEGRVYGVEFEFRKSLGFISRAIENFRLSLNVTLTDSEVELGPSEIDQARTVDPNFPDTREMYRQSPYVVNAGLQYNNVEKGIESNMSFNVFGERIEFVSVSGFAALIYEQPRPDLRFTFKKQLNDRWRLTARASNLLNPEYKLSAEFRGDDVNWESYRRGRDFSLGISYGIGE